MNICPETNKFYLLYRTAGSMAYWSKA